MMLLSKSDTLGIALEEQVLFPDLFRQCLATIKLIHKDSANKTLQDATLSFKASGRRFSVPMECFLAVYGFSDEVQELSFPKKFQEADPFWRTIAHGRYVSNSATQSSIRHPALRIFARFLSNMFFNRGEGNKVHMDELLVLYIACNPLLVDSSRAHTLLLGAPAPTTYRSNMGMRFAEMLCPLKDRTGVKT